MRLLEVCECNLLDHVQPLGTEGHAARRLNKVIMNQTKSRRKGHWKGRWKGGFQRNGSLEPPAGRVAGRGVPANRFAGTPLPDPLEPP